MQRFVRLIILFLSSAVTVFGSINVDDIVIIPRHTFDMQGYSGTVGVSNFDGKVHVAWVKSGKLKYTVRNDEGEWTEPEIIDLGNIYINAVEYNFYNIPNSKRCVGIFIDKYDTTHIAFADKYGSLYYMTGKPGNWNEPKKIVSGWHNTIYPDIIVKDGDVFIIYEDAEDHEMFFISRLKGVWQPVRNMGPGMHGTLSLGSNGMLYFAYRFWDGKDKKYNVVFAYMVPYYKDWTYVGKIHPSSTNPLPQLTDAEKRVEHGPYMIAANGSIYLAWPHRTPGVDSPSPKKCELFCAAAKEPGLKWDLKYGSDRTLFYTDTSAPFPRVEAYSDSTILYLNSRRTGPYFLINQHGKWSKTRTTRPIDLWTWGISQVASDGKTIWILSNLYKGLSGSVDITGLTNPEASQFNWKNNDPVINTNPDTIAVAGQKWIYSCRASDADGDNLTYSLIFAPDSMKINRNTGDIEWNVRSNSDPVSLIGIKVDDGKGGHDAQYFRIRISPPDAGFTAEPRSGYAPLHVQFTDISGGTIKQWLWNFGDDATSSEQNPVHIYQNPGTYSVSLCVSSESGSSTAERQSFITVITPPPAADFTADPVSGLKPLEVFF
ncbi:PKD domain-containing protein, partial [bacterium]|nr:PKD domain-containing protein [bacterium]